MISTNPKVSVLISAYNVERFIGQCISSILTQDYRNLEIIIVDDCSKDSTSAVCSQFTVDRRVRLIRHKHNMRLSAVRNTGLNNASGEYVVFVDGDDWLAPDFVSYMLGVITETNTDMAINLVNFTTRDLMQIKRRTTEVITPEMATYTLLFPHISIGAWNKIYRRDFIERNHLRFRPELFTAEGLRFITDAAQRTNAVGVGCHKVYYYRLNNTESATTKYDIRQGVCSIEALEGIERDLLIRTPLTLSAIRHHLWNDHFWTLRHIIGTKSISDNYELFQTSIKYIREHAMEAIKSASMAKKVKYFLTALFPVTAAKTRNYIFERSLEMDVRQLSKTRMPPPQ